MKQTTSISSLMLGIEELLSKYRASLTVKEIEMLTNVIDVLQEIENAKDLKSKQFLVLKMVLQLTRVFMNPDFVDDAKHLYHQLQQLL